MKTLAAFEAAARLRSFTLAANELHLTHGAISRQIAALEEHYRRALFVRLARGVALTDAGMHLYQTVQEMLTNLVKLSRELREESPVGNVRITVTPSFGANWLLPRLPQFNACYPGITVHLDASLGLADLNHTKFDFAVRDGNGKWDGMQAELLFRNKLTPVCRPDQIQRFGSLNGGRYALPLLHDTNDMHWRFWLDEVDRLDVLENSDGIILNDYNLVIGAALNGVGVAMGYSELIAAFLADGRLVAPFDICIDSPRAYYLTKSSHRLRKPAKTLWDWILFQARDTSAVVGQLSATTTSRMIS
jgi:LysR family glycine cleavage system transcriptional activator